jgi:hypothetical protein
VPIRHNKLAHLDPVVLAQAGMSGAHARCLIASVLALGSIAVAPSSCGPDAVGVDDCRTIESARCEAAIGCGIVEDAESCQRFYRDHCLHGFAASETPGGSEVTACVEAIRTAGKCAADDDEQSLADCLDGGDSIEPLPGADLQTVCDVIRRPERTRQCKFLNVEEPEGAAGAGGEPED